VRPNPSPPSGIRDGPPLCLPVLTFEDGAALLVFSRADWTAPRHRAATAALSARGGRVLSAEAGETAIVAVVLPRAPDVGPQADPEPDPDPDPDPDSRTDTAGSAVLLSVLALLDAHGVGRRLCPAGLRALLPAVPCLRGVALDPTLAYYEIRCPTIRAVFLSDGTRPPCAADLMPQPAAASHFCFIAGPADATVLVETADGLRVLDPPLESAAGWPAFRTHADSLGPEVRIRQRESLGALLAATGRHRGPDGDALAAFQIWQAEPQRVALFGETLSVALDLAVPAGDAGLFLAGRLRDPLGVLTRLDLVTPYGETVDLRPHLVPLGGTDDAADRFVAHVPLARGARAIRQVRAGVEAAGGVAADVLSPVLRRDILRAVPAGAWRPDLIGRVLHPVLSDVQARSVARARVAAVTDFGAPVADPVCSLVIPLYREYGFLRHQVHAFALDGDLEAAEILYVLDAPDDAEAVTTTLQGLQLVYGVPMRLVVLSDNAGYATATNHGVALARGGHVLLMNSDVVPASRGWLAPWLARHRAIPDIGVSGPRLLCADGSVQHAGLIFEHGPMPWWTNAHLFKGWPGDHPRVRDSRPVPAVTGACALVDRGLLAEAGGLSTAYVIGDFEDSDLCLRLAGQGRRCHYFGETVLYHVERASIRRHPVYAETPAVRYNGWLHSHRWADAIAEIMAAWDRSHD
jgi:GT2 family glycosyltransferase